MKEKLIYIATIVILFIALSLSVNKCTSINHEYNRNIATLHDSIHYYKTKSGQLVATTLAYEANIKDLKFLNNDLYNEISTLKSKPVTATHITTTITNEVHDTTYIINSSDMVQGITERFDYSNPYRTLSGTISYHPDTLEMKIDSDKVYVDFTVAMDKKNRIHVVSNNPYVQYNEITGFTLPKTKQKRWSIGPSIQYGYDPINNTHGLQVGISLNYGLIKF